MAPLKFPVQRLGDETHRVPLRTKIFSYFVMLFGPLFLIYLNLRCEKNQCVLFQLPLVIPTHAAAYFSASATLIVLGFILLLFIFSLTSKSPKFSGTRKEQPTMSTGFSSLLTSSMLLVALAYLRPEYIQSVHAEYLRILSVTTVLCFIFSIFLTCLTWFKVISKDRDYPFGLAIFFGNTTKLRILHMDLKYFLYVHVGLVTWGLLDLLHLLNFTIDHSVTAPLAFLTVSQYIVIGHMLLHENLLQRRPFNTTEGLGFFWMMRVLLYLPFLHSLPVFYAAAAEFTLPKPVILADCVLFLFGFVIYVSSVHQKESFVAAPLAYKNLKSITSNPGKRLLISGYWGIVQKPDYFGYVIMWMSWAIACGFSAVSVMVLLVIYGTVLLWLNQISKYNKSKFYNAWIRYNNLVPNKVIPLVF